MDVINCSIYSLLFVSLIAAAAVDVVIRQIPNTLVLWIGVISVSSWPVNALHVFTGVTIVSAAGVLVVGFGLFAVGVLGAGDVKLLTACALALGPPSSVRLLIYTLLLGGLLALFYILVELMRRLRWDGWDAVLLDRRILKRDMPYGVAISSASGALIWSDMLQACGSWL